MIVAPLFFIKDSNWEFAIFSSSIADSVSVSLVELVSIIFLDCSFSCCILENFNFTSLSCTLSVLIFSSISDFLLAASDCSAKTFCLWESTNSSSLPILFFFSFVSCMDSFIFWIWISISFLASSIDSNSMFSSGILPVILSILFWDADMALLWISYCSIAAAISVSNTDFVWL